MGLELRKSLRCKALRILIAESFVTKRVALAEDKFVLSWDEYVDAQPRNYGALWFREKLTIAYGLPAIQPQRVIDLMPSICVGGQEQSIAIELKIYSDSFQEPVIWNSGLQISNSSVSNEVAELIRKRIANELNADAFETELADLLPF